MKRFLFAAVMLVAVHYSLSGIFLPDPPSHWLAPLTNDVRSVFAVAFGKLPFDEHIISLVVAAVAVAGLGVALLALFGWVVPTAWFLPSLLVGSGSSVLLYALFFNRMALIPLVLNVFLVGSVLGLRWFMPQLADGAGVR
ncbi:MAG: hypothetical protein JXA57_10270 [Armatimonadetes bacterium]|nr:hypothetical protein [Armatimonadota bacterium]